MRSTRKQFSPSFVGEDDDDGGGGQLGVVVDGVAARVAGVGNGSVKRDLQKVIWSHQYKIWGLPTINSVRLGFRQQKSRESKLDTALTKSSIQKTYLVFQLRLNERNSFNKIAEGRRFKYRKVQRLKVSNMLERLAIFRRLGCPIQTTQNLIFAIWLWAVSLLLLAFAQKISTHMKRSPNTTEFAVTGIELKKVSTASMVNYLNTQECLMISKVLLDGSPPKNLIWKTFWANLPKIFLHLDQSPKGSQIVVDDLNHPKTSCNISSIGYIIEIMVRVKQARHRKVSWSELEKCKDPIV